MKLLLAVLVPPLGLLLAGKPFQAVFCFFLWLTCLAWPLAAIWAAAAVIQSHNDRRIDRLARSLAGAGR